MTIVRAQGSDPSDDVGRYREILRMALGKRQRQWMTQEWRDARTRWGPVRVEAAKKLGDLHDLGAEELLFDTLWDSDWQVRVAAATALGKLAEDHSLCTVEPLLWILDDVEAHVRQAAAEVLGRIGETVAVDPLIRMLGDEDAGVRQTAAEALGRIQDGCALQPLIHALGDEDLEVRTEAARALGCLGQSLGELILETVGGDESAAGELVKKKDFRVVDPLIRVLGCGEACAGVKNVLSAMWDVAREELPTFLCEMDLARFEKKTQRVRADSAWLGESISYAACRICGMTLPMRGIRNVAAVLDSGWEQAVRQDGATLRVNWHIRKSMFDFDRVEIRKITDLEVEQFIIHVQGDMDHFRRPRYRSVQCTIYPDSRLSEASLRRLRATFGETTVDTQETHNT